MFLFPHGIAVDKDGNVWITDGQAANGKGFTVVKFNPDGKVLMTLDYAFNQPNDVAIAPNGDIFVAEGHTPMMGSRADPEVQQGREVPHEMGKARVGTRRIRSAACIGIRFAGTTVRRRPRQ